MAGLDRFGKSHLQKDLIPGVSSLQGVATPTMLSLPHIEVLKISPPPGFNPWTRQPTVSGYTNHAVPAPHRSPENLTSTRI